jgi:hypothetical protein
VPDFEFDVGISVEEIRGDFETLDESVRQLGSIAEATAGSFVRLDRTSRELGISIRELSGITRETEDIYRDFLGTFHQSSELSAAAVTGFSGVVLEMNNVAKAALNARSSVQDLNHALFAEIEDGVAVSRAPPRDEGPLGDLKRYYESIGRFLVGDELNVADLFRLVVPGGILVAELLDPGKAARRPSRDEVERANTVEDAIELQARAEQAKDEIARNISRRTFLRLQAAETEKLEPLDFLRGKQAESLRRFDIRQQGQQELRQLLNEKDAEKIIQSNERIRAEIEGLRRDLGQSAAPGIIKDV